MNKTIKILHVTSHNEICGIAKYQEQFVDGMKLAKDISHKFFKASPYQTRFMNSKQYSKVLEDFNKEIIDVDIIHIQHELAFYKHSELKKMIKISRKSNKKVIVTIHTAFDVAYNKASLNIFNPRKFIDYLKTLRNQKKFEKIHIKPLKKANLLIVHNKSTKQSLLNIGFKSSNIKIIRMPVPTVNFKLKTNIVKDNLNFMKGDVIFCMVGFISPNKGLDQAIKALMYLPSNFKLAIIGGLHPMGRDEAYLDELTDFIAFHNLKSRVYISGYIEDDDNMNAMIRECNICIYPYKSNYYSYVSSAAVGNALANHMPIIAYPTSTFLDLNDEKKIIIFCDSSNYYELARNLKTVNIEKQSELSKNYATNYSYDKEAIRFADIYRNLIKNKSHN